MCSRDIQAAESNSNFVRNIVMTIVSGDVVSIGGSKCLLELYAVIRIIVSEALLRKCSDEYFGKSLF